MSISSQARARVGGATGLAGGGATVGQVNTAISDALGALDIPAAITDLTGIDLTGVATGDLLQYDGANLVPFTFELSRVGIVPMLIDGGGSVIATGVKGDSPPMVVAGNITGVAAVADQSGSIGVQVWKDTMANFPPVVGDLITTITLSSATRTPTSGSYTDITPIPFSVGDVFRWNVPSAVTSITRVTVGLRIEWTETL